MLVIADENVDAPIVHALRDAGYDTAWIAEDAPSASDETVLDRAAQRGAILLTLDRDFGELIFRRGRQSPRGVIYLRSRGMNLPEMIGAVLTVLRSGELDGQHVTLDRNQTRRRPLPRSE